MNLVISIPSTSLRSLCFDLYVEMKKEGMTRDACTQSTLPFLNSINNSTILTPSIIEMTTKLSEDSTNSDDTKTKSDEEVSARLFFLLIHFSNLLIRV